MTFGQRLKMLRQERGLSQEEMGRAVGVSSRVIGYYESDERFPKSRETLIAFAEAFSVSLDYLLDSPVKTNETGCPARFCYMKSMNSIQREAVNDFIGYLRYRSRKEEEDAREAQAKLSPYAAADLSPDIVAMLENWYDKDDEEAEESAQDELPEEEQTDKIPFGPRAEEPFSEGKNASLFDDFDDDAFSDALPLEAAPEETLAELDAAAAVPPEDTAQTSEDGLPGFVFEDTIPDVTIDSAYKLPESDFRKFFDSDFFVDDFFGEDSEDIN